MKFLLDVCASSASLYKTLSDLGQDVVSAVDIDPCASDEKLLELAFKQKRIFITKDKDFGELVFVRHLPHPPIVRFVEMSSAEEVRAIQELIGKHSKDLKTRAMIVVTRNRIRIRHSKRVPESAKGKMRVAPDLDAPLPKYVMKYFE